MDSRYGPSAVPVQTRARRILVVDDEVAILKLLRGFLKVDGYDVLLAESGEQGLELLRSEEVDLVILDVRMPGMNGLEVCRQIRADPGNARLPVVFLTADGTNELAVFQGLEVGGDEYLHKPIHRRALSARVKNLLRLADVERERQLVRVVAQSEKLAAVGLMAAGVAHEINNPMSFVLANLTCLRDSFDELRAVVERDRANGRLGAPEAKDAAVDALLADAGPLLEETLEGCRRIRAISAELKSFSREDIDRIEPVELSDLARSTLLLTERELAHSATVTKALEHAPVERGSRSKLHQVVLNLVVNAKHAVESRALPPGERHVIRLATRVEGDDSILEISDTGCGVAPEHLAHLFEPFFTTKPVGVGTGLGLSVCSTIVQRLGGRIEVESTVGVGSTFRVVLPCRSGAQAEEARRSVGAA